MDINCDLGESYGSFKVGNDEQVFPFITSCNIACGQHGGDPLTIEQTIQHAIKHQVQIGAHPSYPDLAGFGRRKMHLSYDELSSIIKAQIAIIDGIARSNEGYLRYVKPHGALYNSLANDKAEAKAFVEAIRTYNNKLAILGLPNSQLEHAAKSAEIEFIREGFIDRRYTVDGKLQPRNEDGSVLNKIEAMLSQFESIAVHRTVVTHTGKVIAMEVDSLCIHGDNPHAEDLLKALHQCAQELNINLKKFD